MRTRNASSIAVIKVGGSVLTSPGAYRRVATFIADELVAHPSQKLIAVVSAEHGQTDALLSTAQDFVADPDREALDLLWSTGELRSVALLVLALHSVGVRAGACNVHQTGLLKTTQIAGPGHALVDPGPLMARLTDVDVVVAPGFLARGADDSIVSLGRGGSDLTAVLLAASLEADRCELIKDVAGYFSADPNIHRDAQPLASLSFDAAIAMADDGCDLVQRAALDAAHRHHLQLVVRSMHGTGRTVISNADSTEGVHHGVLDAHDSRRTTVRTGHRIADRPNLPDLDLRAGGAGLSQGI
jgi:aspartate kinase